MENKLTKEQLEEEGWELISIYPNDQCIFQKGTKEDGHELIYCFNKQHISIAKLYYYGLDDRYFRDNIFREAIECKDLNTFKLICNLFKL